MYKRGISIIEIVVSASIITIAATFTVNSLIIYQQLAQTNVEKTQAALLAEEGSEALQLMRDNGWTSYIETIPVDTPFYIYWDTTAYATTTTEIASGDYIRKMIFSAVERDDSTGNIVESGTLDTDTRLYSIEIFPVNDPTDQLLYTEGLLHNVYD